MDEYAHYMSHFKAPISLLSEFNPRRPSKTKNLLPKAPALPFSPSPFLIWADQDEPKDDPQNEKPTPKSLARPHPT